MKRRTARENAFIAAFEAAFRPEDLEEIIAYSRECGEYALDEYGEQLLRAMAANTKQIDGMIEAKLKDWTLRRLPKVNVTILRLALAEMRFVPSEENMDSIVINEAVELAKKYAGDDDYQFINGVLGALSRDGEAGAAQSPDGTA